MGTESLYFYVGFKGLVAPLSPSLLSPYGGLGVKLEAKLLAHVLLATRSVGHAKHSCIVATFVLNTLSDWTSAVLLLILVC